MNGRIPMGTIIRQSMSQIKSYNLPIHMILYCKNNLYDFNPDSFEVRPYNSVIWYTINKDAYAAFLDYLKDIYDAACLKEIGSEDATEEKDYTVGILEGNVLAIDIDKLILCVDQYIKINESFANNFTGLKEELVSCECEIEECRYIISEANEFIDAVSDIYALWNKYLYDILANDINDFELMRRHEIL